MNDYSPLIQTLINALDDAILVLDAASSSGEKAAIDDAVNLVRQIARLIDKYYGHL